MRKMISDTVPKIRVLRDAAQAPKAPHIADYLLSHGIPWATTNEIGAILGIDPDHVRQRLEAPRKRGEIISIARGLWVPVPPDRRSWGAPEAEAYLDGLMGYLHSSYYVARLSAAALYGVAHQAPQVYDVVTGKTIADRTIGRTKFQFTRSLSVRRIPLQRISTSNGTVWVSSIAATILDVMEDTEKSGGIDNAITVCSELAEEYALSDDDFNDDLLVASGRHSVACLRKTGWALEEYTGIELPKAFHNAAIAYSDKASPLVPGVDSGYIDEKWRLDINIEVEPDL